MSEKERDPIYEADDAPDAAFNAWLNDAVHHMFERLAAAPLPEALLKRLGASDPSCHDAAVREQ